MKKSSIILLSILMVVSMLACGSAETGTTEPAEIPNLRVGYGRVCTTPKNPAPPCPYTAGHLHCGV